MLIHCFRLIIITCGMTPVFIAFPELQTEGSDNFEIAMNIIFALDVVLNFFSAFYDADYTIVDDYKVSTLISPTTSIEHCA